MYHQDGCGTLGGDSFREHMQQVVQEYWLKIQNSSEVDPRQQTDAVRKHRNRCRSPEKRKNVRATRLETEFEPTAMGAAYG